MLGFYGLGFGIEGPGHHLELLERDARPRPPREDSVAWGVGFGVQGSGFRVQDLSAGCRVLGSRVVGAEFRVEG